MKHLRTLVFHCEPTAKGRPRMTRSGHTFTPAKTRKAEELIRKLAKEACAGVPATTEPLAVEITFRFRRPKSVPFSKRKAPSVRPDVDNLAKLVLDATQRVVFDDDAQIVALKLVKEYTDGDPSIEMQVFAFT